MQAEDFSFLSQSGCVSADGIDDAADFEELNRAFAQLNVSADEVDWVFSTVAGVLWLGNLRFNTAKVAVSGWVVAAVLVWLDFRDVG